MVTLIALVCVLSSLALPLPDSGRWRRGTGFVLVLVLFFLKPVWDPSVYAVGLYNRIGEFVDLSPRAIDTFVHEGWDRRFYKDGQSASVAIGQSRSSQNIWLSINGKVDASTGDDMPTQILSGRLPMAIAKGQAGLESSVLVVGLASGVTAGEALASGAVKATVVELEPAVVEASRFFEEVNHKPLADPRTTLLVDDARAVLSRSDASYGIIISEPSNPWLTGVSNLFTQEYWALGRSRLEEDGVFCQWVQLYALPPLAFRSLIATYISVFPQTWLFETIPGADALLISAPQLPTDLPIQPTLGPEALRLLAADAPLNTDNRPWIEFEAPKWVNRQTGKRNSALIEAVKK